MNQKTETKERKEGNDEGVLGHTADQCNKTVELTEEQGGGLRRR
jgi:hypothetical protein